MCLLCVCLCVCVCVRGVLPVAVWLMASSASSGVEVNAEGSCGLERGGRWEGSREWRRVFGMRHSSGWLEFCDEDEHEGGGRASRGAVPEWQEVGDGERAWADGCVAGFMLGFATAMAGVAWWVYG